MMLIWEVRKEILYGNRLPSNVIQTNPAPECKANDSSVMVVDEE